ncbi:hypothetical protein LUU34_01486700 [Aix galericulata]|nr:hypothetical protein LUU34_01486700 [Aix galericulata]
MVPGGGGGTSGVSPSGLSWWLAPAWLEKRGSGHKSSCVPQETSVSSRSTRAFTGAPRNGPVNTAPRARGHPGLARGHRDGVPPSPTGPGPLALPLRLGVAKALMIVGGGIFAPPEFGPVRRARSELAALPAPPRRARCLARRVPGTLGTPGCPWQGPAPRWGRGGEAGAEGPRVRRCQDGAWGIPGDVLGAVVAVDKTHPQAGTFGPPPPQQHQRLRLGPGRFWLLVGSARCWGHPCGRASVSP